MPQVAGPTHSGQLGTWNSARRLRGLPGISPFSLGRGHLCFCEKATVTPQALSPEA